MHTPIAALATAVIEAMNSRQLETIRDLVTDDFEVHDVVAATNVVAIRATAHGVNAVAPQGIEPTGLPFAMKTAHFFRSRDGLLCEHWGIRDELDVLYQVGALAPGDFALTNPERD